MNNGEGSKYEMTRDLDTAEIAKLIRADIKAAIASGALPTGTKCSVTISRFAGGSSIDIRVKACPVKIWTDAFIGSNPHVHFEGERRTEAAKVVLETLEAIHSTYNFNHSDSQSDYFHVRYYGHASFAWELEKADREATKARLAGTAAAPVALMPIVDTKAIIAERRAAAQARVNEIDLQLAEIEGRQAAGQFKLAEARAEAAAARLALATGLAEAALLRGAFAGCA